MPVLVVAGSLDDKFADTGQEMVSAIGGNARLLLIEGAGHACHLQDPRAVAAAIEQFVG
jgi:pimeloyl-ACP methyl ester carboxylesterase